MKKNRFKTTLDKAKMPPDRTFYLPASHYGSLAQLYPLQRKGRCEIRPVQQQQQQQKRNPRARLNAE